MGIIAGSIGAIALKRSGFFKPIFKVPYPPIDIPVKTRLLGSTKAPYFSATQFGSSSVTNISQVP